MQVSPRGIRFRRLDRPRIDEPIIDFQSLRIRLAYRFGPSLCMRLDRTPMVSFLDRSRRFRNAAQPNHRRSSLSSQEL